MPLPLLIALFLAFGLDSPRESLPSEEIPSILIQAMVGIVGFGLFSVGFGALVAWRIAVFGYLTTRMRRIYLAWSRLLVPAALATYGWILFELGWRGLVESNWGLRDSFLVGQLTVIAPFLPIQFLIWYATFLVEKSLHSRGGRDRRFQLGRYLFLKGRQALGLILPVVLVFLVQNDIIARFWPEWTSRAISEPIDLAFLGCLILCMSPIFVRLAFPTHPLPEGPLRRRLEHLSERVGFRFRDILVWDTSLGMVNACVTGVLPGFRYILLTDALIDVLDPREVSAVFGHEIGHIAHRHLQFFGFFFLGSLGLISLAGLGVGGLENRLLEISRISGMVDSSWAELIETGLVLTSLAIFFWFAFGHLSRRFERQADVFGCAAVSCGSNDCPPHDDPDDPTRSVVMRQGLAPCPTGILIFTNALGRVAHQNGLEIRARSWRHGSIARRIAFLESLRDNPGGATRFQRGVRRLRLFWGVIFLVSISIVVGTQFFSPP